jgi:hypothetical protein
VFRELAYWDKRMTQRRLLHGEREIMRVRAGENEWRILFHCLVLLEKGAVDERESW